MMLTNPEQYPYPFNGWITKVLSVEEFLDASKQIIAELQALPARNIEPFLQQQHALLSEMVQSMDMPEPVAQAVWEQITTTANQLYSSAPAILKQTTLLGQYQPLQSSKPQAGQLKSTNSIDIESLSLEPMYAGPAPPKPVNSNLDASPLDSLKDPIAKPVQPKGPIQYNSINTNQSQKNQSQKNQSQKTPILKSFVAIADRPEPATRHQQSKPSRLPKYILLLVIVLGFGAAIFLIFNNPQFKQGFKAATNSFIGGEISLDPARYEQISQPVAATTMQQQPITQPSQESISENILTRIESTTPIEGSSAPAKPIGATATNTSDALNSSQTTTPSPAAIQPRIEKTTPVTEQAPVSTSDARSIAQILKNIQLQASELNIEPVSDKDTALALLTHLKALNPSGEVLAEAHSAIQKGYEAISMLAKARQQYQAAQDFSNKAASHEKMALDYKRPAYFDRQ